MKTPKTKKPKKDIDIFIDGKKTDVLIQRINGKWIIDIDGQKRDVRFEKEGKKIDFEFDGINTDIQIEKDENGIDVDVQTNKNWLLKTLKFFRIIK